MPVPGVGGGEVFGITNRTETFFYTFCVNNPMFDTVNDLNFKAVAFQQMNLSQAI